MTKNKNPLEVLLKSPEWFNGYKEGVEYGIQKERNHPQKLRFGVQVKDFIIKKFTTYERAFEWGCWNYKRRLDYFTVIKL